MKKILLVLTILIAFFTTLSLEAKERKKDSGRKGKAKVESYKIGGVFAITGPASLLGEPERNTMVMIIEMINEQGGIDGVPVEAIIEDSVGDETKAVNAVKKLINSDKVLAIVGTTRSGTTMAVIPIVEKAKTPLVSCAAAETIVNPVKRWVFKTPQLDRHAADRIYGYMIDHGIRKVAIMSATSGFGNAGREQLRNLASKYGIEIVADETYGPKDTDMTPQFTKIRGTEAQAVVNWSIVPAQAIVAKNMVQLGMKIPLFQSHGFGNIKYVEAAGAAAEGIIFPAGRLLAVETVPASHPQKDILVEYKTKYEARYNDPVSTFGGHAWDATWILIEALKHAGADKEGIRDYIENMKGFVGTGGVFNFSETDHCGLTPEAFEMLTVKNGKFVFLQQ